MREPIAPLRPDRPKRVTMEQAHHVCQMLKRDGSLDVILNILRDRGDTLDQRIRQLNGLELLKSNEAILTACARGAALGEIDHLITLLETYSRGLAKIERPEE